MLQRFSGTSGQARKGVAGSLWERLLDERSQLFRSHSALMKEGKLSDFSRKRIHIHVVAIQGNAGAEADLGKGGWA